MGDIFSQQLADELREDLRNGVVSETKEIKTYLKCLDFLATCSDDDIYSLADMCAFNKIIEANCILAAEDAGISGETIAMLKEAISFRLDRMDLKKLCKEYDNYRFHRKHS